MNSIKQITLSQNDFIVEYDNSSLKLNCKNDTKKILIDISHLNLISALKVSITCSTYCFIKNFGKKLCWIVKDEEIKMINEKLDYYMLKASDEESDVEDVLKLIKRLDELEPISLPWESDE